MISAYLDNNIFVYLENGSLEVKTLHSLFDTEADDFFYASAHIQELLERKGEDEHQKIERIKFSCTAPINAFDISIEIVFTESKYADLLAEK